MAIAPAESRKVCRIRRVQTSMAQPEERIKTQSGLGRYELTN